MKNRTFSFTGLEPVADFNNQRQQANVIGMANETRFVESNFSEPLTAYATGWSDQEDIRATLNFIAPDVQTTRRFEFAQGTNAEDFLSETDDVRAIGGSFKRVEYTTSKVDSKTFNKGLCIMVDHDNVEGQANWQQLYTGRLMKRLLRNELRRAVTLLAAASTNTAKTWGTTQDPDQDMTGRIEAFVDAVGIMPSRALYDATAWNLRRTSFRSQATAGGFASAGMNESEVAGYLGLMGVKVSRERYVAVGSSTTKARVLTGGIVLIFTAQDNLTTEDPSNIKRFWSPTKSGTPFRVYVQELNAKFTEITVEHYSNIVVTSSLGVQKITAS